MPRPAERGEAKNSFELYSIYTATYKISKEIFTLLERKIAKQFVRSAFNMYYVYILQSLKNKSLYIGYTADLKKRFNEHNNGESSATKPLRPYKIIFYEAFINKIDAKRREEYLKSGWGFRSIKKMLKNYFL